MIVSDFIAVPLGAISLGLWVVVTGLFYINGWVEITMAASVFALFISIVACLFLIIPRIKDIGEVGI